jgi:hypothetical protein
MLPMLRVAILLAISVIPVCAQDGLRGHWTGGEQIPDHAPVTVEIDLDRGADGWIGSLSIPARKISGIPLEVTYADGKFSFRIKGMPDVPTYKGTVSQDGKTIEGDYIEGTLKVRFKFTRAGEPNVEIAEASLPVPQEFVGDWEGALRLGRGDRTILRISSGESGARAVLISVDEDGVQVPATSIELQGSVLTIVLKPLGGARYVAEINKDVTELKGTLDFGGYEVPLNFKKRPAPKRKD